MISTQGTFGQPQVAGALLEGLTRLRLAGPIIAATSRTLGVFDSSAG